MDKNTIIGLVLIGTILSVFTILNKPSEEELAEKAKEEQQLQKEKATLEEDLKKNDSIASEEIDSATTSVDNSAQITNSTIKDSIATQNTASTNAEGRLVYLENEKYRIYFNTKGGMIACVALKEFESYNNYAKEDGKITPLKLFRNGDAHNQLVFPMNGKTVETKELPFKIIAKTDQSIVFETDLGDGKKVQNRYTLKENSYDLDYTINMQGFAGEVEPRNVALNWDVAYRKSERLFSEQRRVSTICYKYDDEGFDYLSEMSSDDEAAEDAVEWVAYKQSYFSSILQPNSKFSKDGTKFSVESYDEKHPRDWTHLKDYSSTLNLGLSNTENASVSMNWYFGPNGYDELVAHESGYEDILNYGWGIFRWINVYAVQPLFNFLSSIGGISIGIAILLLTIIIKFALMPIQWKMYTSSAKMRILKPEIDEINEKYPNKEDGMKKQMETMTLYRESGASPLSGCVPMLVQMPILLALFRFFPSTFALRQKSFLWAEDLSSYDSILDLGFNIWPYGDHVSLFTLLMAGTTLIYTIINSGNMQAPQQPGMPNMKVIMYFFPIMMIFFFNNYSSGLSYYYFISTLMSILIMLIIKKYFVNEDKIKLKMAERKATRQEEGKTGKKKKSKFQQRLEKMQKAQQEQLKQRKNKK